MWKNGSLERESFDWAKRIPYCKKCKCNEGINYKIYEFLEEADEKIKTMSKIYDKLPEFEKNGGFENEV